MRCEHLKDKMKKSQEKALYSIPGWEEFVSNGFDNYKIEYRSFEDAREYVRNENLNNGKEWHKWCKSGKKPDNIPSAPNTTYKDFWVSWGDWLGTGNTHKKEYRSFEDAREYVRNEKLDSQRDWQKWSKSGKRPDDIPSHPDDVYKDSGWISWANWLGK